MDRFTGSSHGHEDISTTADVYVRPGNASLEAKLAGRLRE
jgi:hypothetical protein